MQPLGSREGVRRLKRGRGETIGASQLSWPEPVMQRLCVFCGSSTGSQPAYRESARLLGELLVARDLGLVYGGGQIGLMGVLADAVLQAGGQVIGVIPQSLVDKELAHAGLTELRVVATMHQRKALMADLADGFIALPGGFGTADELFEILTWAQLGLHAKPIGLVNVEGFFDPLLAWLDHTVEEQLVRPEHRQLLLQAEDAQRLLELVLAYRPAETRTKWIAEGDR
jgi:uncharacterized protein (TIGR00730 family)